MLAWRGSVAVVVRRPLTHRTRTLPRDLFRGAVSLSAKKPRRRGHPAPEVDDEDDAALVVTGIEGGAVFPVTIATSSDRPPPKHDSRAAEEETEVEHSKKKGSSLKGFDVLQALQKATVRKKGAGTGSSKKVGGKMKSGGRARSDGREKQPTLTDDDVLLRPLQIKDDWSARLDEMERRIQELLAQYHH